MSHTDTEYCKIAFDHTCNGILVIEISLTSVI